MSIFKRIQVGDILYTNGDGDFSMPNGYFFGEVTKVDGNQIFVHRSDGVKNEYSNNPDWILCNIPSTKIQIFSTHIETTVPMHTLRFGDVIGFDGDIEFDRTKPDGTPKKVLDVSKIHGLGWKHKTDLIDGIYLTYHDYLKNLTQKEIFNNE